MEENSLEAVVESAEESTPQEPVPTRKSLTYEERCERHRNKKYPAKRHPEIDKRLRAKNPPSLQELADIIGVSREGLRQYLIRTDQNDLIHRRSLERRTLQKAATCERHAQERLSKQKTLLEYLQSIRRTIAIEYGDRGSWAVEETIKRAKTPGVKDWRPYYLIYSIYDAALSRGKHTSYRKIGKQVMAIYNVRLYDADVQDMLDKANAPTLCWAPKRVPESLRAMIRRGYSLDIPLTFIAHALDIDHRAADYQCRRIKRKCGKRAYTQNKDIDFEYLGKRKVNFNLASRIYEAQDSGLSLDDIMQRFSLTQRQLNAAVSVRETVASRLAAAIGAIYEVPGYDKPYVSEELRARLPKPE